MFAFTNVVYSGIAVYTIFAMTDEILELKLSGKL
jgi:hypothetical protein